MMTVALPKDTNNLSASIYYKTLRDLGAEGRAKHWLELQNATDQFTLAGIQSRHPEYTPHQIFLAQARLRLGRELFALAYGFDVQP